MKRKRGRNKRNVFDTEVKQFRTWSSRNILVSLNTIISSVPFFITWMLRLDGVIQGNVMDIAVVQRILCVHNY